jgi:salicylate hydroxylase
MMPLQQNSPVLIAGGGIGGLSAALALASHGIQAHVIEAAARFSESGAGIQIGPNGARLLRRWGLGEALEAEAGRPEALIIGDGPSGRILSEIPLGRTAESRYGAPYHVAGRALLHRLLHDKARQSNNIDLTTNFPVLSVRNTDDGVAAMTADGRELKGTALIGADGVHSRIRLQLFGRQARPTGWKAWRSTAKPAPDAVTASNAIQLWLGPRGHVVKYCCGPEGPLNAVAITQGTADPQSWGSSGAALDLKPNFADWDDDAYSVLHEFDSWKCWPLLKMTPLPRWSEGRITLLGDAAHPIMPFLASGAVMAMEDAAILADEMARTPDVPALAFRQYEARRRGRIARVRRGALQMGAVYHMQGPMRLARNMVMQTLPPLRLLSRNDWLYGYCADPV